MVDLGGLWDAIFDGAPRVSFTVEEGHTGDATVSVWSSSGLAVLDSASVRLQVRGPDGEWNTLETAGSGGLIDIIGLSGNRAVFEIKDLEPGEYRVIGGVSGLSALTTTYVEADIDYYDHTTIGGYDVEGVSGNVIDNNDTVTETTVVTEVNGVAVGGAGTTPIEGEYGTLVIDKDGNYSYTPDPDASGIGQVDKFTYTLVDPETGESDTATLHVSIDSDGQGLVWGEPGDPATVDMVANDDAGSAGIDSAYRTEDTVDPNFDSLSWVVAFGQTLSTTEQFTVAEGTTADVQIGVAAGSLLQLGGTLTMQLHQNVGGSWVLVTQGSGSNLADLVGLLPDRSGISASDLEAGTYRVSVSYRALGIAGSLNVELGTTTHYLDDIVIADTNPATGNVLADDTLGSTYTTFLVKDESGNFTPVADGTTVAGDYGTLTINADGSYSYEPDDLAGSGQVEEFEYRLEHPNGQTSDATLSISVEHGDGPYEPAAAAFSLLSDDLILDEDGGEIPSEWLGEAPDDAEIPAPANADVAPAAGDFLASAGDEDLNGASAV